MADIKWQIRYLRLAQHISEWSKDPSTKVGAVAVGQHGQILSQGYNGFPRGVTDLEDRLEVRDSKYLYTIHAEMNCVFNDHSTDHRCMCMVYLYVTSALRVSSSLE